MSEYEKYWCCVVIILFVLFICLRIKKAFIEFNPELNRKGRLSINQHLEVAVKMLSDKYYYNKEWMQTFNDNVIHTEQYFK